jgi:endo-alpha-1,4-polygalactosaminidase (GH114 family)
LQEAKKYALYYGTGRAEALLEYDLAVVEPLGQNKTTVERMQQANTIVIGYVSVMEIHPSHLHFNRLKAEDFLVVNGQPCINEAYGTYLLDLRSKRWLGMLNHQIGNLLLHTGYDGIFLDTIGDVEMRMIPPGLQIHQIQAAVRWMEQLRVIFPEHILVQNNGLEVLCLQTAPWIDAICWENPPFGVNSALEWMEETFNRLDQLQQKHLFKTLLLFEQASADMKPIQLLIEQAAKKYKFLSYIAPAEYVSDVF